MWEVTCIYVLAHVQWGDWNKWLGEIIDYFTVCVDMDLGVVLPSGP